MQVNVVTTEFLDWATNCPEYKVTAVQVSPSNGPLEWQEEYEELTRQSRRRRAPGRGRIVREPRPSAIFAYIDAGRDGLDPPVKEAILSLRGHGAAPGAPKESSFQGT